MSEKETRTQRKWEDNINMDFREMGCGWNRHRNISLLEVSIFKLPYQSV
jgi:hypothetical protein